MSLIVQKYGGTSLATIDHIKSVSRHIADTVGKGNKVVAVVSAMGHQTDELIELAHRVSEHPPGREMDMLLTVGERISMSLMSIALHDMGVSSMSLTGSQSGILTDDCHGNARIQKVLGDRIRDGLLKRDVVIIAGFQGMSVGSKEITTLGRGGTDLTAVAIAHTLKADSCQIYKDVDGICTADPNVVDKAKALESLTWKGLLDLTWAGAPVLHARAAHLALKFQIPLEIRSSFNLDRKGTLIRGVQKMESVILSSLVHKKSQTYLSLRLPRDSQIFPKGLQWLWQKGETPLFNQQESSNGHLRLQQLLSTKLVDGYVRFLSEEAGAEIQLDSRSDGLTAISIVGEGFWQSPETQIKIMEVIEVTPVFFDSRNTVITLAVDKREDEVLKKLHQQFFENP